ncbi:MAG: virulence RhuM family protein [Thermoguttaceae bacterium]|nr:virulence RhuM family protein [Thermoguttaceae bacterium]
MVGATAAEIVYANADRAKENMGLTTWKNSPNGRILKSDVTVAKNYLTEAEIRRLERLVSSFFDYIEDLIERENAFTTEPSPRASTSSSLSANTRFCPTKAESRSVKRRRKPSRSTTRSTKRKKSTPTSKSASPRKTARRAANAKKTTSERTPPTSRPFERRSDVDACDFA